MGYDCTLHLVDERAIREELVPRLLGASKRSLGAFDALAGAEAFLAKAREVVFSAEPADAARALTELAITFASASLPHLSARGTALSLWHYAPKKVRSLSPISLGASPEPMFRAVIAKRKDLRGKLPTQFEQNYMTGVFIPAARVGAARAWMDRHLAKLNPGERETLAPIERVLAAAEKHGLAYWEATDLDVPLAHEELLAEPPPKDVEGRWKIAGGPNELVAHVSDVLFVRTLNDALLEIDVARLPPKVKKHAIDHVELVAKSERGWLLIERRKDDRPFRFRLFRRAPSLSAKPIDAAPAWKARAIAGACALGDTIYGHDRDATPPRLLVWSKDTFVPAKGVPPARGKKGSFGVEYVFGFARTGDGAEVLIWDGNGYELAGKTFEKTFPLDAKSSYIDWTYAPLGPSSFAYLSNRQVFVAERGKKPRRVASKLTNVMFVAPGPAGSILCRMGDNRNAWAIAAIDSKGKVKGLHIRDFAARGESVAAFVWCESASALLAITDSRMVAIPRSVLAI